MKRLWLVYSCPVGAVMSLLQAKLTSVFLSTHFTTRKTFVFNTDLQRVQHTGGLCCTTISQYNTWTQPVRFFSNSSWLTFYLFYWFYSIKPVSSLFHFILNINEYSLFIFLDSSVNKTIFWLVVCNSSNELSFNWCSNFRHWESQIGLRGAHGIMDNG